MTLKLKTKLSKTLTRRWRNARPGSVLILVVALLVLLALIGTAYLSSTQGERYTSSQNTLNTEADLLMKGIVDTVNAYMAGGAFGTVKGTSTYRAPSQEMPLPAGAVATGYNPYTSSTSDLLTGDRLPLGLVLAAKPTVTLPVSGVPAINAVSWNAMSFPLFTDSSGNETYDSPFENSVSVYAAANKSKILALPTYKTFAGQIYPAFLFYIPTAPAAALATPLPTAAQTGVTIQLGNGQQPVFLWPYSTAPTPTPAATVVYAPNGAYLTQYGLVVVGNTIPGTGTIAPPPAGAQGVLANPTTYPGLISLAANASGDGIADSALTKLPLGQIDGITYYTATRIIDDNSAINANTAWSATSDATIAGATQTNYGFFRSNIGLGELLNQTNGVDEMSVLNAYRINAATPPLTTPTTPLGWTIHSKPVDDTQTDRTDFGWFSIGDAMEQQLARRLGNPGYNTGNSGGSTPQKFASLELSETAKLASRFSLSSTSLPSSMLETIFPTELAAQSTPWSPAQVTTWYLNQFYFLNTLGTAAAPTMPLRALLTTNNPVSNAMPSRISNLSSPPTWTTNTVYNFGDWVMDGPAGSQRSFVCIQPHKSTVATQPEPTPYTYPASPAISNTSFNSGAIGFWAGAQATAPAVGMTYPLPGVPWTTAPAKVSINTGSFEELWLGFCHVMTDSISPAAAATANTPVQVEQWLPPMLPTAALKATYLEEQLPMFRSVIRDNRSLPISNNGASLATVNTGNPGPPSNTEPAASPTFATRVQLTPMQMMQLRAAIAAINTQSMRNSNSVAANRMVRSRHVVLGDLAGNPAYDVEVFGNDIQPFISQMFAQVNDDGTAPSQNFIAIELINPFPTSIQVTTNWGIGTIDRTKTAATAKLQLTPIGTAPLTAFTIPAATAAGPGKWVIYDGNAPGGVTVPPGTSTQEPGLIQAIGKEVVILKPRLFNNNLSSQTSGADTYVEGTAAKLNLYDMVPVDQIDMTGTDAAANATEKNLYYRRAADPSVKTTDNATFAWNFVWPGFYTPYNSNNSIGPKTPPNYVPSAAAAAGYKYNQSIAASATGPTATNPNFTTLASGTADTTGLTGIAPTYNTITLQLFNDGFPGPNPVMNANAANGNMFPFGGFARAADMLQIPYIGAYRICQYNVAASTGFYEMNSVTMDSSLANDSTLQPSGVYTAAAYQTAFPSGKVLPATVDCTLTSPAITIKGDAITDPFVEQIGRFCPIGGYINKAPPAAAVPPTGHAAPYTLTRLGLTNLPMTTNPQLPLDNGWLLDFGTDNTQWHYHWAKRLFDYFTVSAPNNDYFPNVDPAIADSTATPTAIPAKYPAGTVVPVANSVASIANAITPGKSEDQLGVDGVININTAPWPVLAMLPFVPRGTNKLTFNNYSGETSVAATVPPVDDNIQIAQAIVAYRNAYGPFKSIMDLYSVPAVRLENDALLATEPGAAQGDFSPGGIGTTASTTTDGVRFDFEERFLLLNRISNLITTRSDTFTCYVLLQGWRGVGTGNPTKVIERRAAFLLDRNVVTPTNKTPFNFPVPTE